MPWSFSDMYGRQKVVDANVFPVSVPIFDITLASTQTTIDVLNIPQNYANLKIRFLGRSTVGSPAANDTVRWQANGDTGANYDMQVVSGNGSTVSAFEENGVTGARFGDITGGGSAANYGGLITGDIHNYTSTTFFKNSNSIAYLKNGAVGAGTAFARIFCAVWKNTSAITSLSFLLASGSAFAAGTRLTIWGDGVVAPASPGSVLPVTYSTTLPSSPLDGQEAILVDNVSTPTYQWRFRYNANSANTDKWEFVGGTPLESSVNDATLESLASSVGYVDFTTNASLVAPRAGQYIIEFGGTFAPPAGPGNDLYVAPNYGSGASDNDSLFVTMQASSASEYGTFAKSAGRKTIAAGATVKLQYRTNTGIGNSRRSKYVRLIPVRVS